MGFAPEYGGGVDVAPGIPPPVPGLLVAFEVVPPPVPGLLVAVEVVLRSAPHFWQKAESSALVAPQLLQYNLN